VPPPHPDRLTRLAHNSIKPTKAKSDLKK